MKTLKLISLFVLMAIMNSCDWFFSPDAPCIGLSLSFQDASGKDLIKGIGYTPESEYFKFQGRVETQFFTLKVFDSENQKPSNSSQLFYFGDSGNYSLLSFPGGCGKKSRFEITCLLTCPYVFGDDTEHEIVAYCKEEKHRYKCYRLTFDGVDVEFEQHETMPHATGTVVLD